MSNLVLNIEFILRPRRIYSGHRRELSTRVWLVYKQWNWVMHGNGSIQMESLKITPLSPRVHHFPHICQRKSSQMIHRLAFGCFINKNNIKWAGVIAWIGAKPWKMRGGLIWNDKLARVHIKETGWTFNGLLLVHGTYTQNNNNKTEM